MGAEFPEKEHTSDARAAGMWMRSQWYLEMPSRMTMTAYNRRSFRRDSVRHKVGPGFRSPRWSLRFLGISSCFWPVTVFLAQKNGECDRLLAMAHNASGTRGGGTGWS